VNPVIALRLTDGMVWDGTPSTTSNVRFAFCAGLRAAATSLPPPDMRLGSSINHVQLSSWI
jgi:hypothetical protein